MKFNFSQKGRQPADTRYAYVKAGMPDAQWDLYTSLLSRSLARLTGPLASVSGPLASSPAMCSDEDLVALRKDIRSGDVDFVAKLAVHFGEERNFRELAFLLTAELAAFSGNDEKTALLVARIVRTPGDVPQWLEYYFRATRQGQRPQRAIRRQLNGLLNRLDEYQYTRGTRKGQLALRDALHLLRPRADDRARRQLFTRILRDQLPVRTTWEQEWHALYQQHYDSMEQRQTVLREKWKEGISSFRIGYTALLDNLRPMLCAGVSGKVLKLAAEYLGNGTAVRRSGVSPLRLLEVYRSLRHLDQGGVGMLCEALERAVQQSSWMGAELGSNGNADGANVSVIAMDVSNSMKRAVNGFTNAYRFDIAPLLGMLWKSRGDRVITGIVGNTWRTLELPARPILQTVDEFRTHEGEAGYATNAYLVIQDLLRKQQVVDRVMIFTDCRLWDSRGFNQAAGTDLGGWWRAYRRGVAPEAKLYLFDLAGYGSKALECLEEGVFLVAGWQDRIFEVLEAVGAGY